MANRRPEWLCWWWTLCTSTRMSSRPSTTVRQTRVLVESCQYYAAVDCQSERGHRISSHHRLTSLLSAWSPRKQQPHTKHVIQPRSKIQYVIQNSIQYLLLCWKCAAKYKTDLVSFLKRDSLLDITPNMVTEYKGKMSLTLYQKVEDKNANAIHQRKVHIIMLTSVHS